MSDNQPPFDSPFARGRRDGQPHQPGFPQQPCPEHSGGFAQPGGLRELPDPTDDPELRDVAELVREVLQDHRMRPAARELLRARLTASAAAQVQGGSSARLQTPVTPATQPLLISRGRFDADRFDADNFDADRFEPDRFAPHVVAPEADRSHDEPDRDGRGGRRGPLVRPGRGGRVATGPSRTARRRPPHRVPLVGWSAMGAAAGLAGVLIVLRALGGAQTPSIGVQQVVSAVPGIVDRISADPGDGLSVSFSQLLDEASVDKALRLAPATTVTTSWQGNTMTVSPVHGFAPNSAYVLTIDHTKARTKSGAPLASDIRVTFGTAPVAKAVVDAPAPVKLSRTTLTAAEDKATAVVAKDGSVLVTAARANAGSAGRDGLVRVNGNTTHQLGSATPAICVSRSGRSIAFLSGSGSRAQVVFADSTGTTRSRVPVTADASTPIGWIDDEEVTFISGGKLHAVDRSGRVRAVLNTRIDAGDTVVLAPGGRFVYLSHNEDPGVVVDLTTRRSHRLTGVTGAPAFSADGSTVYWVEAHSGKLHLDSSPSAGGPMLSVELPGLRSGDTVSDLAVSPDSSTLAYSVTHVDRSSELRLASLPTAVTVGISPDGAGTRPHWAPSGSMLTVLAHGNGGTRIQTVAVPTKADSRTAVVTAVAQSFANAQISGDAGAQRWVAPDVTLPKVSKVTRAGIVAVRSVNAETTSVTMRLSIDPTTADPVSQQATETLLIKVPTGDGAAKVTSVSVSPFTPAPAGPKLTRVDTSSVPGAALLTFDSDLNPQTVPSAIALLSPGGTDVAVTATYNAATRTIQVQPATAVRIGAGTATVVVTTALHDVAEGPLAGQLALPVQLTATGQ